MSNKIKLAGLSQLEANQNLCTWLLGRLTDQGHCLHIDDYKLLCFQGEPLSIQCVPGPIPLFDVSHDSIHRVLDAMTDRVEQLRYLGALKEIFEATGENCGIVEMLLATPFQKCEAALLALELGEL